MITGRSDGRDTDAPSAADPDLSQGIRIYTAHGGGFAGCGFGGHILYLASLTEIDDWEALLKVPSEDLSGKR